MNFDEKKHISLSALKITGIYLVIGIIWIFFSDRFLLSLIPNIEDLSYWQTLKGIFYVLLTGILLWIMIVRNISKTQKILSENMTLENQVLYLQKVDSMGFFTRYVVHEITNFLQLIRVNLSQIESISDAQNSQYSQIHQDMESILHDTQDFMNEIKFYEESGDSTPTLLEPISILQNHLKLLQKILPNEILFYAEISNEISLFYAQHNHLTQVITNLVINARDAIMKKIQQNVAFEQAPRISVRIHQVVLDSKKFMEITINDNGTGISPENEVNLYQPYYTASEKSIGSGLGLFTVKKILSKYNATINHKTNIGEGTTFNILWPLN